MSLAHLGSTTSFDYLREILRAPVYEAAITTPLEPMPILSARLGNTISVKREDDQPVHSFKIRGAYTRIRAIPDHELAAGVITASAGNHAQGVALSARILGIPATIVMPVMTAEIKVDAVRRLGGSVVLLGSTFDEAQQHALTMAAEHRMTYIPPFDDPLVIAGQGTIGLELIQQDAHLDRIFVPIGGGGLAAGVALIVKTLMPDIKVIGVEPAEAAGMATSIRAGHPVALEQVGLFAEGVAVKQVGQETFALCRDHLDDVVTVSSDAISAAVKDLFDDVRAIAEPAGALALAGLKEYVRRHDLHGERLAHVLSGANINFHGLRYISERAELGEHREAMLGVTIPERPGAFLEFCQLLGTTSVTEFAYRAAPSSDARLFVGLGLRRGVEERQAIVTALRQQGYDVLDLSDDEMAKTHVRYMIGGLPPAHTRERLYSFEFPESPGALLRFLTVLGSRWNITLFHYRSHGTDYGRVLCGFEGVDTVDFPRHLEQVGYPHREVTDTPAYQFFLADRDTP